MEILSCDYVIEHLPPADQKEADKFVDDWKKKKAAKKTFEGGLHRMRNTLSSTSKGSASSSCEKGKPKVSKTAVAPPKFPMDENLDLLPWYALAPEGTRFWVDHHNNRIKAFYRGMQTGRNWPQRGVRCAMILLYKWLWGQAERFGVPCPHVMPAEFEDIC